MNVGVWEVRSSISYDEFIDFLAEIIHMSATK